MRRPSIRQIALFLFVITAAACGGTDTFPVAPTPEPVTETFSGTINHNGAAQHAFIAQIAGTVTATLAAVSPDKTIAIGFALGTWNGSSCHLVFTNDSALEGTVITGGASSAGTLCVRVYDVGNIVDTTDYVVTVAHP